METINSDHPLSDAKFRANRKNAKKSTGPKTAEGKQNSSRNSFKHGLTGQIHIATTEEMATYQAFCQEYFDEWKPTGPTEKGLVQDLADSQWQIHRAAALMNNLHPDADGELTVAQGQQLDRYSRHGSRFKRDFERTVKQIQALQQERKHRNDGDLRQAARIQDMQFMLAEEWEPPEYGFVLTVPQIKKYMLRRNIILDSMTAMKCDYDKEKFLKALALNLV